MPEVQGLSVLLLGDGAHSESIEKPNKSDNAGPR